MGAFQWGGLEYVCETLLDAIGSEQSALWVADADGVLCLAAIRGADQAGVLSPGDPVWGPATAVMRTPAEPDHAPVAVLALPARYPLHPAQELLDEACPALGTPAMLQRVLARAALADGMLEAFADQAAILDGDGVVVQTNAAWTQTPASHRGVIERSAVGSLYPHALRGQVSRPARIAAEGIEAVLRGTLPAFQSDYDTGTEHGDRSYSLQVDPLPTGGAVVRHIDISFRKHLQRQLAHRATHDPLTGLPNRMVMNERLGQAMIRASHTGAGIALLFCDVDAFKQINDSLGHAVGDRVLIAIARRLQESVRQADVVARFGGDEFVVLLEDVDEQAARTIASVLQTSATRPIMVDGRPLHFSVSIGVSLHSGDLDPNAAAINAILNDADAAMYQAKRSGRGSIRTVPSKDPESASDLTLALDRKETRLLVQPIVSLDGDSTVALEAFARLDLPDDRTLLPADFLQRAEESGAIVEIGRDVLAQAVQVVAGVPDLRLSVNVSWAELCTPDYAESVLACLRDAGVGPQRLEVEVLIPAAAPAEGLRALRQLRDAGAGITLDAFGRQPVELALLPDLAVSGIKVDRTLIAAVQNSESHARLVRGLVALAGQLGLVTTAEGIETAEQAALVRKLGFQRGQGFFFGTPRPPAEATLG